MNQSGTGRASRLAQVGSYFPCLSADKFCEKTGAANSSKALRRRRLSLFVMLFNFTITLAFLANKPKLAVKGDGE
jgi:hypothetical protein